MVMNEYSGNVEKCGIPVNVKLMTRWNVNGTAALDSVPVCHSRAKKKPPRPPTAVKPQRCLQQRPVLFLHELFIFLQIKNTPREQSVMKGFLLGFVRRLMEGPSGFLTLSYLHVRDRTSQSLTDNASLAEAFYSRLQVVEMDAESSLCERHFLNCIICHTL